MQALSQTGDLRVDERSYEPCVLYMNGQYWGVYDMREKVDDADFTKEYYDQDANNIYFIKTWGGTWNEYGGAAASADWDALRNYINANNMGDPTAFAYVDERYQLEEPGGLLLPEQLYGVCRLAELEHGLVEGA